MDWRKRIRTDCPACGQRYETSNRPVRCGCGSPLTTTVDWEEMRIDGRLPGLWRYGSALPFELSGVPTMGEGWTPLVIAGKPENLYYKLEFLFPTGSFKDRGSVMVMAEALALKTPEVVQDSSGNAGASIAAYAARSKIKAVILVPASTSEGKRKQIRSYGAQLCPVEGDRTATAREAWKLAQNRFYASHVWNPLFLEGTKTFAFEIWEQLGFQAPDVLFLPAGNGTLLLGAWKGFSELLARGLIERLPRLFACQSAGCAPLHARLYGRSAGEVRETVAEGIAVAVPPRIAEMEKAVSESGGTCILVEDAEVIQEQKRLAGEGFLVEPTGAVASAAALKTLREGGIRAGERIVVPLTGSGLKNPLP